MFTPSLYIDILFLEEREGVYFKLKYLLCYLQFFFFFTLSKNIFGKSWTNNLLSFAFY